ncbi:MAG TPA: hypothetical protein VG253_22550 [Streptosporangiaceae bacterium]|nr:hypothetical protein [Streptosporangiaceae bacterium]
MWLAGAIFALLAVAFWVCWSRWPRQLARPPGSAAEAAFRRHPAGRARYPELADEFPASLHVQADQPLALGPDDDPEFLTRLDQIIRDEHGPGEG